MLSNNFLTYYYDEYPQIEEAFQAELDKSLQPRSRELRFDLVKDLNLQPGCTVFDVGCGEGRYAFELAKRFGFSVKGFDPVPAHVKICNDLLDSEQAELKEQIDFAQAPITKLPTEDKTADLVWCYDVLEHIEELDEAFTECYRVLKPGGYMLIYSEFATDSLADDEADFIFKTMGFTAKSANHKNVESAYESAGFNLKKKIDLMSEWEERSEEDQASVGRHALHAARLLREPKRYIEQFGQKAYDIMLGDCLWHIYPMIGKFSPKLYILQKSI